MKGHLCPDIRSGRPLPLVTWCFSCPVVLQCHLQCGPCWPRANSAEPPPAARRSPAHTCVARQFPRRVCHLLLAGRDILIRPSARCVSPGPSENREPRTAQGGGGRFYSLTRPSPGCPQVLNRTCIPCLHSGLSMLRSPHTWLGFG